MHILVSKFPGLTKASLFIIRKIRNVASAVQIQTSYSQQDKNVKTFDA